MARVPSGKKRNINQILGHVCNAEEFYVALVEGTTRVYLRELFFFDPPGYLLLS